MQEDPVAGPVGRDPDRPLHPGLADTGPGGRIGREVAVVGPFQAVPGETVHVPGRRDPDADRIPVPPVLRPGLELPEAVEADFVAVGLLQAVRQPLGGGEATREPDAGPEEGGVESDEEKQEGPFHGARFCTKLPRPPLFIL